MKPSHSPSRNGSVIFWVVAGIAFVSVGGYVVSRLYFSEGPTEISASDLFTARKMSFDIVVPASGELEALNQIEIRSELERSTKIKTVVEEGKFVKAGDILVELNSEQIESEITQERLQVEAAMNDVDAAVQAVDLQKSENDSAARAANLKVELAELELDRWQKGEVVTRRADLALAVKTADENVTRYERDYKNSIVLEKQGFISKSELEGDKIQLDQANNDLEKARRAIKIYEEYEYTKDLKTKTSDLEEARASLDRTLSQNLRGLERRENDLDAKRKTLVLRQDKLKELEDQLALCVIKAPSDGLVVYQTSLGGGGRFWSVNQSPLQVGRDVYPNETLIVLPDTSKIVASVKVHESLSSLIKPDMPATVKVDAKQELSLPAKVRTISVLAEQNWMSESREYTIKLLLDQPNTWDLKPSMRCKADIQLGRAEEVLAIPIQAVFAEKGVYYVWKPDGAGRFVREVITTGRASETTTEVIAGLSEGDVVLLREPLAGERGEDDFDTKIAEVAKEREMKRIEAMSRGVRPGGVPGQESAGSEGAVMMTTEPGSTPADSAEINTAGESAVAGEPAAQTPTDADVKPAAPPTEE